MNGAAPPPVHNHPEADGIVGDLGQRLSQQPLGDKTIMRSFILSLALTATAAFNAPVSRIAPSRAAAPTMGLSVKAPQLPAAAMAAMIMLHAEAAHAKGVIGVSGGLDFGPLAGKPRSMLSAA